MCTPVRDIMYVSVNHLGEERWMCEMKSFVESFERMEEPRNSKNLRYPLIDVLVLSVYGVLCGKTDFSTMADYLKLREPELTEAFGLTAGVPSHDVFSDVFRRMDVQKFLECFLDWLSGALSELAGAHVAIDGKALIASTEKSAGRKVPYILNAYICGMGISICQLEVGEKSNEITYIPKLLDLIDISGCMVTVDAIGTQKQIMDLIKEKGGDFCLQLKLNQPKAYRAVNLLFCGVIDRLEEGEDAGVDIFVEEDHGHGRDELRTYMVRPLDDAERALLPKGWGQVLAVGMTTRDRVVGGKQPRDSHEVCYSVLSRDMPAEEYAGYARGHWGIENGLHHVLDVHLGEDGGTARRDNARSNLALLRKIALNLVMQVKERGMSTNKVINRFQTRPETFRAFLFETVPMRVAEGEAKVK